MLKAPIILLLLISLCFVCPAQERARNCKRPITNSMREMGYSADRYFYLGVELLDKRDYELARDCFLLALEQKPKDDRSLNNLGLAYGALGCHDEAIDTFQRVIRLKPKEPKYYYMMGREYAKSGQFEEAIIALKEAIRLRSGYDDAYFELGTVYDALGRDNDALETMKEAIRRGADRANCYAFMGISFMQLSRPEEAEAHFKKSISLDDKNVIARDGLGRLYTALGEIEKAMEQYRVLVLVNRVRAEKLLRMIEARKK